MKLSTLLLSLLSFTMTFACSDESSISQTENAINVLDGTPCTMEMETFSPLSNAYPESACVTAEGSIILSDANTEHECVLPPGCDIYLCCNSDEINPVDAWNIDAPWAPNGPAPEFLFENEDQDEEILVEEEIIPEEDDNETPVGEEEIAEEAPSDEDVSLDEEEIDVEPPCDDSPGLDDDSFPEDDIDDYSSVQ